MIRSVVTAALIGLLGGFWIALVNDSIELFRNYVDGIWRYQFAFRSVAEVMVGAVIGVLVGANIRLALSEERVKGFIHGAVAGVAVGALLVLAQVALVALAANLVDYRVNYQSLLTRFSGIIFTAAVSGIAVGMLSQERPPVRLLPSTIIGALIGISFMLPVIVSVTVIVSSSPGAHFWTNSAPVYVLPYLIGPIVGTVTAATIAVFAGRLLPIRPPASLTFVAVMLGAFAGVTCSSPSFFYVLGWQFLPALPVGIAIGIVVGVSVLIAGIRKRPAERQDGGTNGSS